MGDVHRFATLIPWYVNGTLEPDERAELENHVAACESCRDLLEQARAQHDLAAAGPLEARLEHVRPELLVTYAERPESLEPETRAWIESRLAGCESCRDSLARLRDVDATLAAAALPTGAVVPRGETPGTTDLRAEVVTPEAAAERPPGPLARIWQALSASVLRPAPALAYLLLLLALPVAWLGLEGRLGTGAPDPLVAPRRIVTGSERTERSALNEPAAPLRVPLPSNDEPLLLELRTDLRADDVRDLDFVLEIARDGEPVWSEPRAPRDFTLDDGRAALTLLLHPRRLGPGRFEVLLRVARPGDPLDRQALFRRVFVVGG